MLYNNIDRGPGKSNIFSCLAAYGPYGPLGPMALWAHTRAGRRMMHTREDDAY